MRRKTGSHLLTAAVFSLLFHVVLCIGFGEVKGFEFLSRAEQTFMTAALVEEGRAMNHRRSAAPAVAEGSRGVASATVAPPEEEAGTFPVDEETSSPAETPEAPTESVAGTDVTRDGQAREGDGTSRQEAETTKGPAVEEAGGDGIVTSAALVPTFHEERLEYDIRWEGVPLGNISLAHSTQGDESRIDSRIRSSPTLSMFYRVSGHAVSTLRRGSAVSFHERHEAGRRRSDKETLFDPSQGKVVLVNHLKGTRREFASEDRLWDFVSGLYFLRAQDLDVGRTVSLHVFDSSKFFRIDMNVLRREEIEVAGGRLRTLVLKPGIMPYGDKAGRLFENASDILIWLTDDAAKVPVRIEATTKMGRVVAALTREERPGGHTGE